MTIPTYIYVNMLTYTKATCYKENGFHVSTIASIINNITLIWLNLLKLRW